MGSHRRQKVDDPFYDIFTVFDFDGVSTVSGETVFAVDFVYNDTPQTLTYSISEIGTTGDYVLEVPDGFPSKGLWTVTVEVDYNGSTWRSFVDVTLHDIDEVYDIVIPGGVGVEDVTIQLRDESTDDPIVDALINIWNATETVLITYGRTDTLGNRDFNLDEGDYVVKLYKPGVSFNNENLTVPSGGGTFTYYGSQIVVSPPADPNNCTLYADLIHMDGTALPDFKISLTNLYDPNMDQAMRVMERYVEDVTDANGHIEFEVVRGARLRVSFVTSNFTRDITVPDTGVANLLEIFGVAADAFAVRRIT
jgi:hypothetical protein